MRPVHPARPRNDHHRQVSWLPGHRDLPAFPAKASGIVDKALSGYSCGGSLGLQTEFPFKPLSGHRWRRRDHYADVLFNARP